MACFAATKWKRFLAPPTVCPLVSSQSCKYARYVIRSSPSLAVVDCFLRVVDR